MDMWLPHFGQPKQEFLNNCERLIPRQYQFISGDSFSVNKKAIFKETVTTYFYDGGHDTWQQKAAFTYFNDIFDNSFIALVDDWNWDHVRQATYDAFTELKYTILYEQALPAPQQEDLEQWWNGLYIAVIRKNVLNRP